MLLSLASHALIWSVFAPRIARAAPSLQDDGPLLMDLTSRASTCNTASNRACWTTGFNISTDYETSTPVTGKTVVYNLEVTEHDNWLGPDGHVQQKVMLVNNQLPGPTIVADWGDMIQVTVKNSLQTNGTSIHWHGIRQLNTNLQDGANGVTECPIRPGTSKTYTFLAQQYGTTWYHSHFSAQYGNGVFGGIQIHGPASLPYDIDLGTFTISDYYYNTSDQIVALTKHAGPPASDNVLFNGTNINPVTGQGKYANVTLTPGKRHLLRLINPSVENHVQVSLVKHSMTVIGTDLVPVNSLTTQSIFLGVGQRYDVTIDASQTPGNYWFNVTYGGGGACGISKNPFPAAIFHYAGAPGGLPTDQGTAPPDHQCLDDLSYTPVVQRQVDTSGFQPTIGNNISIHLSGATDTPPNFVWLVNGSAIVVDWDKPVDEYLLAGDTAYPRSENIIVENSKNQWGFWLIENDPDAAFGLAHPMHLHGHDFVVLGRSAAGAGHFKTSDKASLKGTNPVRRDVTMLPPLGWLVLAFKTDNPGAWLMHCHIAWHVSGGLSVDFVERRDDFKANTSAADQAALETNCNAWREYYPSMDPFKQQDSGLKLKGRENIKMRRLPVKILE